MKLKMVKVLSLQQIYPKFKEKQMSIKTTYKMSKLFNAVSSEAEFYSTQLSQIINEYAVKDDTGAPVMLENGEGVQIQQESISIVQSKFNELWGLEVELPDIKFTLGELGDVSLSLEEFNQLLPFIED